MRINLINILLILYYFKLTKTLLTKQVSQLEKRKFVFQLASRKKRSGCKVKSLRQDIFEIQKNTSSIINQLALSVKDREEENKNTSSIVKELTLSVKDLIGYNRNRDEELEILLEEKLLEHLEANDWEVDKINRVDMIYNSEGVVLTELDGIIFGRHTSYPGIGFFFFLEAKQVFDLKKYKRDFKTKFPILKSILDELPVKNTSANSLFIDMCKRLFRYKRSCSDYRLVGVLGSPCIEASLLNQLIEDQISTITQSSDQYVVNLII